MSDSIIVKHSLVVKVVDGQPMVSADMVQELLGRIDLMFDSLMRAVERQGYVAVKDPASGEFSLERKQ